MTNWSVDPPGGCRTTAPTPSALLAANLAELFFFFSSFLPSKRVRIAAQHPQITTRIPNRPQLWAPLVHRDRDGHGAVTQPDWENPNQSGVFSPKKAQGGLLGVFRCLKMPNNQVFPPKNFTLGACRPSRGSERAWGNVWGGFASFCSPPEAPLEVGSPRRPRLKGRGQERAGRDGAGRWRPRF